MQQPQLSRRLGMIAVTAVVAGNMLGSGIFFTPGQLFTVSQHSWHVYFFWTLAGLITLCGALTLGELSAIVPESGATFHIIREAFGEFWGFVKIWVEMLISGPGSVAGIAIVFGEYLSIVTGFHAPVSFAITAILFFTAINLRGVQWSGRTQIILTSVKIAALLFLILGCLFLADPVERISTPDKPDWDLLALLQFVGLGVAAVLFTYDGWIDVTHAAGEVSDPKKNLPRGLIAGVTGIIILYLIVNFAFLRVVSLEEMRAEPNLVAAKATTKFLGQAGSFFLNSLILISIFGALGGLLMTLPRLFFGAASLYSNRSIAFRGLAAVSSTTSVPFGSILYCAAMSIFALLWFQSFSRLANFFLVSLQFINILMVASIYRLRKKSSDGYKTPGYPVIPFFYIAVMTLFLINAIYYNPKDTLVGIALTLTCVPVYLWIRKLDQR